MSTQPINLSGADFRTPLTKGLAEPSAAPALGVNSERSAVHNREVTDELPCWQEWRQAAHEIKQYAIANLDKMLVEFEQKISARGAVVLWAKDAAEANQHVLDIAKKHSVKSVVKSKSMVSEEMDLDHVFEAAGIRPVETDLGEYIVQLAGQRPVHIVAPAIHMSAADVGHLFQDKLGEPYTEEHTKLTDVARRHLREEYLKADMGMSGCNFAVADTGTVVVIENEGNAGLSTATPPVHVVLVGIEKMLPKIDYLPLFLNVLGRSATGQKLTSYTHLIHGETPGKKLYVIILDNGRSRVLADPKGWASLFCIRCGSCMNNCPVYRRVGGWAYGWVYPGPIGSILSPQMLGLETAGKLPFASSLCGACAEVCPVKIDIPHELVHLRHRAVNEPSPMRSMTQRMIWAVWAWFMAGPIRYKLAMTSARIGIPFLKFLPWHPSMLGAWTRGRELPQPPKHDFRSWWKKNKDKYES
jgi:L-lactate dehydrogenase complex protein LldF